MQCWRTIVYSNISNKFQSNLKRNSNIAIDENAFENVVCKMAVNLPRSECVTFTTVSMVVVTYKRYERDSRASDKIAAAYTIPTTMDRA